MPEENLKEKIIAKLANHYQLPYVHITGRATTGIYLLLKTLGVEGKEVVFPALICPSVAYAIFKAKGIPVPCDSSMNDYNIDLPHLQRLVNPKTGAIIVNHLFGHPLSDEIINFLLSLDGIPNIEDIAQAPYHVTKLPIKVMSFGRTKPICADGGGAVLCDDPSLNLDIETLGKSLPPFPVNHDGLSDLHKELFKLMYSYLESGYAGGQEIFTTFPNIFCGLYFHKPSKDLFIKLNRQLNFDGLAHEFSQRRITGNRYKDALKMKGITHPVDDEETVYYRYSVLAKDSAIRDKIVHALRGAGIHASSLYDSLHIIGGMGQKELGNSINISGRIINLWTESQVNEEAIQKTVKIFSNTLAIGNN